MIFTQGTQKYEEKIVKYSPIKPFSIPLIIFCCDSVVSYPSEKKYGMIAIAIIFAQKE